LAKVALAGFVPDHSGVAAPDSHGVPFSASSLLNTDQQIVVKQQDETVSLVITYHNGTRDVNRLLGKVKKKT